MSLYRVDDIVDIVDDETREFTDARIIAILNDVDITPVEDGLGSSYIAEIVHDGHQRVIRDDDIMDVTDGPTIWDREEAAAADEEFEGFNDAFGEEEENPDQVHPIVAALNPDTQQPATPPVRDEDGQVPQAFWGRPNFVGDTPRFRAMTLEDGRREAAERQLRNRPIENQEVQATPPDEPRLRFVTGRAGRDALEEAFQAQLNVMREQNEREFRQMLVEGRTMTHFDVEPIATTAIGTQERATDVPVPPPAQPVDDHEGREYILDSNRGGMGITRPDYAPMPGETRHLMLVTLRHGWGTLTPYLASGGYVFRDERGQAWVNQHQVGATAMSQVPANLTVRDINNQIWCLWTDFIMVPDRSADDRPMMGGYVVKGKSRRKKLRRKYDKIPEIKEEKYYASKDFVA